MASYNKSFSGYQFEPGGSRPPKDSENRRREMPERAERPEHAQPRRARQPERPARAISRPAPEPEDDFDDDYRPGTMLGTQGQSVHYANGSRPGQPGEPRRRKLAQINEAFDDSFEDDFDDDIITERKAPPSIHDYRPPRTGYTRQNHYGADYDEEQFREEFAGIKGLGVRRRELSESEKIELRRKERREREAMESDGYNRKATMMDGGYDGSVGVPKLFADYFRDDAPTTNRRVLVSGRSATSYVRRSGNRRALTVAAVVITIAVVAGLAVFLASRRVTAPLKVQTALSSMDKDTSTMLVKYNVDETLAEKNLAVNYAGDEGKSGSGTFRLSDCDFEYTANADGTVEYIEVEDADGKKETHTLKTMRSIRFDETKVRRFLNELVGDDGVAMVEPTHNVLIMQDRVTWEYSGSLTVKAGTDGYGIDYDVFIDEVMKRITEGTTDPIATRLEVTHTPEIDVDSIYEHVHQEPADAYSVTDGMGNVTYYDHTIGQDFNASSLRTMVAGNGTEWTIDLKLTVPKMTIQELRKDECPDLLATYYTEYNTGNVGRSSNLELAAKFINESPILQPGDVFSFNKTVGERTQERGFSKATVYSSEGTDEDYGGGICQVSSTLYYTTVLANLKSEERHNHMFTVNYMKNTKREDFIGNDATVNWGTLDFKFSNSKQYPIRIEFITAGGVLTCNIYGTWDGYTADLGIQDISSTRFSTIYRRPRNGKETLQYGQRGREIDTYRIIYFEGEKVDKVFEDENNYLPLQQIYYTSHLPAGKQYDVEY